MANIEVTLQRIANENTKKQFDWQERMSNTAHTREVKDLKTAGLNPVLSSGGSGSPSYTTSVDSAVNALGNIGATRISSAAQLRASKLQARAMVAAAQAQASAAKYAADQHYAATRFQTLNAHVNSFAGVLDKWVTKASLSPQAASFVRTIKKNMSDLEPQDMFKNYTSANKNNFQITAGYSAQLNNALHKFEIRPTMANKKLFVRAFVFNDINAQNQLTKLMPGKYRKGFSTW